jgi:hypothetical protein
LWAKLAFFSVLVPTGTPLGLVVRHLSIFIASSKLIHYFNMFTATELGVRESLPSNIASRVKAGSWLNQLSPGFLQAGLPMVKAILLEINHPLASPLRALTLLGRVIYLVLQGLELSPRNEVADTGGARGAFKDESLLPKGRVRINIATLGSPKGSNSYGDRDTIVPAGPSTSLYSIVNATARGRVSVNFRSGPNGDLSLDAAPRAQPRSLREEATGSPVDSRRKLPSPGPPPFQGAPSCRHHLWAPRAELSTPRRGSGGQQKAESRALARRRGQGPEAGPPSRLWLAAGLYTGESSPPVVSDLGALKRRCYRVKQN